MLTACVVLWVYNVVESFVHGVVCVTIWLKDVPDPIYQDCRDQQCTDAQKIAKKLIPSFQCPIQKGCMFTCKLLSAVAINCH